MSGKSVNNKFDYDVAVIGGGPAGMIAAGRAAELGARVALFERNPALGKKLLLTGNGRCNITNAKSDSKTFTNAFGQNGQFLFSSLHKFGVEDTIHFFNKIGVETKVERGQRVFPVSDSAQDVLNALKKYLRTNGVTVYLNTYIRSFAQNKQKITKMTHTKGSTVARNYIICTGGLSCSATGSTGDGLEWAQKLGHSIVEPQPALVPVKVNESWVKELQGLSLKNVEISIYQGQKKCDSRFGEALFTSDGLSGPIIIDMSKQIGTFLKKGTVHLAIDLKPALDFQTLDKRLQRDLFEHNKKMLKNSLERLLPKKLIPVIIRQSGVPAGKKCNKISKEERRKIVHILKKLTFEVKSLYPIERAIITAGGIDLSEIDSRTLKSKVTENLYFAGEVIDLDGPTGGYNLQVCWTTGYVAGESVAKTLQHEKT